MKLLVVLFPRKVSITSHLFWSLLHRYGLFVALLTLLSLVSLLPSVPILSLTFLFCRLLSRSKRSKGICFALSPSICFPRGLLMCFVCGFKKTQPLYGGGCEWIKGADSEPVKPKPIHELHWVCFARKSKCIRGQETWMDHIFWREDLCRRTLDSMSGL